MRELVKTVGAGHLDERLAIGLSHARTGKTSGLSDTGHGQRERWQRQVMQKIDERFAVAGENGIDNEEAGDWRRWREACGEAALDRKKAPKIGEDQLQNDAPHKGRSRDTHDRPESAEMVA